MKLKSLCIRMFKASYEIFELKNPLRLVWSDLYEQSSKFL